MCYSDLFAECCVGEHLSHLCELSCFRSFSDELEAAFLFEEVFYGVEGVEFLPCCPLFRGEDVVFHRCVLLFVWCKNSENSSMSGSFLR